MIPTMILFGLVLGRWWRVALVTAAVGWPLLLAVTDAIDFTTGLIVAAALAVANAGVGVLAHQGCLHAYRHLRHRKSHAPGWLRPPVVRIRR
jgi:hypothetical protein